MGIRTTQFMGLSEKAQKFLQENVQSVKTEVPCECGKGTVMRKAWNQIPTGEKIMGMFEEEVHDLSRYFLKDGRIIEEFIQAEPWNSGPCIFLALRDAKTKKVIGAWPKKAIEEC